MNVIEPAVGDKLYAPPGKYWSEQYYIVTRVARVKFDVVRAEDYQRYQDGRLVVAWTFRKDTGREDGAVTSSGTRLYTVEQWARQLRSQEADDYLKTFGIEPWRVRRRGVIDTLVLADLIRWHQANSA